MTKESGLGAEFYIDGYDLSGDVGSMQNIGMPLSPLVVTGINKLAQERIMGKRDGVISFNAFWNTTTDASFDALKAGLFTGADKHMMYFHRATVGTPAAALVSKRSECQWNREEDGGLSATFTGMANAYGLDWGQALTAGLRTDTTATNGTSVDGGASTAFGLQAYLQVFSFTGTSVTVTLQDSADNSSWAAITGGAFTAATARGRERLATGRTATVRRYVRATTSGTFSSAVFAVMFRRNKVEALT